MGEGRSTLRSWWGEGSKKREKKGIKGSKGTLGKGDSTYDERNNPFGGRERTEKHDVCERVRGKEEEKIQKASRLRKLQKAGMGASGSERKRTGRIADQNGRG